MSSTDSDSDTLAAVLAYLESYSDSEETASPLSSEDANWTTSRSSSSDEGAARTKRPTRRVTKTDVVHNRGRSRQKIELAALRQEEATLRDRLGKLLQVRHGPLTQRHGREAQRSDTLRHGVLTAWRDVTKRQFQRRRDGEKENSRLRARVTERRHVIKTLKRIIEQEIHKSRHPLVSSRLYSPAWKAVCADGDPREMMRVFAELVTDLKQTHLTTDAYVMKTASNPLTDGRFVNARATQLSPTQLHMEIVDIRLLPFPFDKFGDVYVTKSNSRQCSAFNYYVEPSQVEGRDTLFCGKAFDDDHNISRTASVRLRAHTATQKFEDADQIVFANVLRSGSVQVDREDIPGMHTSERFWNVFRPPTPNDRDTCLMLSFTHVVLTVESGLHSAPRVVPILFNYFQQRVHDVVDHVVALAEDWLLDPLHS
ncbi:hypothetical protein Poli38472_007569 [Pythium oligandrum]|uniref:Uncharacterized protein n=1 Tax=Pythium oligandrum TaxID=41045 RepID=A0A8K1CQE6_PYTOL|nr:hypothetical protein Poli38472_007569 [Pythium oligandrum]|eukprot:TMW67897.1 hypothetical protein Poli38472_007569 [Pythium oligandrum]